MEALAAKADAKQQDDLANQVANALESGAPQSTSGDKCRDSIANFFNMNVPWRARVMTLALIVGLMCGVVACMYDLLMEWCLHKVWMQGGPLYASTISGPLGAWVGVAIPDWTYIMIICTVLGGMTGLLIRLLGEPMANLPGVVLAAHRDGQLGYEEAPAMAVISITNICAGGSLGPEAPLVSIGGGLATWVSMYVDLSEAETLFVTMCGMGAGLAAFFGEPVGGALFACEVLHRYGLEYYEAVVPTVVAGLACNWSFRVLANLPQEPIWHFPDEEPLLPWTSILGVVWGMLGGILGWAWIKGTKLIRGHIMVPLKLGPKHIVKGLIGGFIIGMIGVIYPETMFWAEYEAQTIITQGEVKLMHGWPTVGVLGEYSLADPAVLIAIGMMKLVAISITVLAGYRGGFIFPFMFAGHSIGCGIHIYLSQYITGLSPAAIALSMACSINVAVTRTVIATPIVLATLSGRTDCFPTLLVASIVSLYMTGDESIIVAARKRWLRAELDGIEALTDRTPPMERNRTRVRTPGSTPNTSLHGGNLFMRPPTMH